MIRVLRAELVKVVRRRVLMITAAAVVVFAIGGAAIVLTTAEPAATVTPGRGPTARRPRTGRRWDAGLPRPLRRSPDSSCSSSSWVRSRSNSAEARSEPCCCVSHVA